MTNETAVEQLNKNITVFSLIVTGALGVMAFQVLPSLVIGMINDLSLNEAEIGRVSSAQLGGVAFGSLITLYLVKIMSWRRLAFIGLVFLLLTDIVSIFVKDYHAFLIIRLLAGTAGGICVSFGAFALGNTRTTDRNFGLFLAFQVVSSIIGNMFLPGLVQEYGVVVIFLFLIALEVFTILVLLKNIPNIDVKEQEAGGTNSRRVWFFCILQLVAMLFFFTALGGFWTYIAPIGLGGGLLEEQVGKGISLGLFGGLAGSFVAAQLNIRIGRLIPVLTAVALQFVALGILFSGFNFIVFTLSAGLFMFGWYMFYPYQLGTLAALDRDGRPMILANAVAGVGSAMGPLLVSLFLSGSFTPAFKISAVFLFLAVTMTAAIILIASPDMKTENL